MKNKRLNRQGGITVGDVSGQQLKLAVRLAVNQLSDGIGLSEAVQFAAKYYNVTCAAIEGELSKRGVFDGSVL